MQSAARQGIIDATSAIEAAAEVLAHAEAAHALGAETAESANAKVRAVAEAEQEAATDLVGRINGAVRAGGKLHASPPSAAAVSRASAEADAASARQAVQMLGRELDAARKALAGAQEAQRLATQAVVAETVEGIASEMAGAFALIERRFFDLRALESAGFTATAAGGQRLTFSSEALRFLRWELTPRSRPESAHAALAGKWRAWREGLVENPAAAPLAGAE